MNSSKSEIVGLDFASLLPKVIYFLISAEQEYTPIETVEVAQPRDKPVQKSGNNYQSIIDRASG